VQNTHLSAHLLLCLKASRPVHPRGLAIQRVFRRSSVPGRRLGRAQYSSQLCNLFFVKVPVCTWCLHQQNGLDPKRACIRGSASEVISMLPPCNRGLPATCASIYGPAYLSTFFGALAQGRPTPAPPPPHTDENDGDDAEDDDGDVLRACWYSERDCW